MTLIPAHKQDGGHYGSAFNWGGMLGEAHAYSILVGGYLLTFITFIHAAARWSVMDFTIIFALLLFLGVTLLGRLLIWAIKLVGTLPPSFRTALFSGGILLLLVFVPARRRYVCLDVIGLCNRMLLSGRCGNGCVVVGKSSYLKSVAKRYLGRFGGGVGCLGLVIFFLWFFFWSGPTYESAAYANSNIDHANLVNLPDPTQSGEFKVSTLYYGTGTDKRRPEYGSDVDLVTETVDGTPFIDGWSSVSGWYRDTLLGI